MKKIQSKLIILALLAPNFSFAQGKTLADLARMTAEYLNIALSLIIGLAILFFVWNVFLYFFTEKDKTEAGKYVLFSVIGFFVILSFWGIVNIFINTLQLDSARPNSLPPGFNFNTGTGGSVPANTAPSITGATSNPSSGTGATSNTPSGTGATFNAPSGSAPTGNGTGSGTGATSNPTSASPGTSGSGASETGATGSDSTGN